MNWEDEILRGDPTPPKPLTFFYIVLWVVIILSAMMGA